MCQDYVYKKGEFSFFWNLQTNCLSKLISNMQEQVADPRHENTAWTISCKAWKAPVEYPSWEYKFDIQGSDGNMFNSIFQIGR